MNALKGRLRSEVRFACDRYGFEKPEKSECDGRNRDEMKKMKPGTKLLHSSACLKLATLGLLLLMTGLALPTTTPVHAQSQTTQPQTQTESHPFQNPQNPLAGEQPIWGAQTPPRDPDLELALKITAPFTVAAVGDIIEPDPVTNRADAGFQSFVRVIRAADVGFANMESSLVDMHHREQFIGPIAGTLAPKEVGEDIKALGINMMNRANNHALDGQEEGMLSTDSILDELGIVHAGSGMNLEAARAARYMDTPKGRVGLIGTFALDTSTNDMNAGLGDNYGPWYIYMAATERIGDMGGRPGVNPLRLTTYHVVPEEQLQALRAFWNTWNSNAEPNPMTAAANNRSPDSLQLFNEHFKAGPTPWSLSYVMNPQDENGILKSIRNGKVHSDFMIATIHAHDSAQVIGGVRTVSDYLVKFAHDCIDNGADMFVASGPHMIQPVEIYKGKPIFYGLAGFIFQTNIQISGSSKLNLNAPQQEDLVAGKRSMFDTQYTAAGLLVTSHFEKGRLVEIRLYPVDLGSFKRPSSDMGIPTTPSPDVARQILEGMQAISKPFGTTITIENNVGVIRVPAATAAASTR